MGLNYETFDNISYNNVIEYKRGWVLLKLIMYENKLL